VAFVEPEYSKSQVNKAGAVLVAPGDFAAAEREWADRVLANWRACHGYPINTFQATLRLKLKNGYGKTIVAQRLKRAPSIVDKLKRFEGMQLARMQDIGGLRAVVSSIARVRRLEAAYRATKFDHTLAGSKNYIDEPKEDGYRSAHLIYRYKNPRAPQYDGLSLELQLRTQLQHACELQLRTQLQHAWATAVETMSTFLGQALKSGQGERSWRQFFEKASAALALVERTAPVPGSEGMTREEVFADLAGAEHHLRVLEKLEGFAIAADQITAERGQGAYHLIVLNSSDRTVTIRPYAVARLEEAAIDYADMEERTRNGEPVEAVLVSAGPIDALRKAYPNYFLRHPGLRGADPEGHRDRAARRCAPCVAHCRGTGRHGATADRDAADR
jgi:putative GTP pyrophosphokinase